MAVTANSIITAQAANRGHVQIANADAQAQKTVYTAGANGSLLRGLLLQSTDTSGRDVQISITNSGTSYPLGTVTVPAGAGNSGSVPSVNALNSAQLPGLPLDTNGNPTLFLVSGDTLTVSALSTVTAAKLITASAIEAGDL
jgi:hypothetical protein